MFGFVRPAACRSSAPRSVTDGCPYPPLPCRAKNRNKIQLFSHRKQEINGNGRNSFHRLRLLLPPLRRSPSLEEGGLGAARALSNFLLLLRVQGRNPARFKGGYGVPRGFKGEKSKSPPNPLGLAERVHRPQTVEKDGGGFHDYGYSARWAGTNPVFTKTSNGRNAIGSV